MTPRSLAALACLLPALALAEDWHVTRRESDGLTVETRASPDTSFPQIRVRVHAPSCQPSALADAVWSLRVDKGLMERQVVLEETTSQLLVWQLVRPPMVSRRESLVRYTRARADDGAWTVRFHSEAGRGPVSVADAIRVALVRGLWRFTPDGQGGAWVEHSIVSDPGGGIPAWLASGSQQDIAVALVRDAMLTSARR